MTENSSLTNAELVTLLRASDHSAFTEIYERYYYVLFTHAFKKLTDEDQAKDIIQALFMSLWTKRENIGEINNLPGYLLTSLRNRIFNHFEHQMVESKYIESLKDYVNTGSIVHTDHLLRENEWKSHIENGIQSLPKKMGKIFEFSRKSNLTHKKLLKLYLCLNEP